MKRQIWRENQNKYMNFKIQNLNKFIVIISIQQAKFHSKTYELVTNENKNHTILSGQFGEKSSRGATLPNKIGVNSSFDLCIMIQKQLIWGLHSRTLPWIMRRQPGTSLLSIPISNRRFNLKFLKTRVIDTITTRIHESWEQSPWFKAVLMNTSFSTIHEISKKGAWSRVESGQPRIGLLMISITSTWIHESTHSVSLY